MLGLAFMILLVDAVDVVIRRKIVDVFPMIKMLRFGLLAGLLFEIRQYTLLFRGLIG
jgi:hypothetical protein